ncbi:SusE domain-containing protein [Dysgonomonas sp. BGC7]|uniref:SusE domain-containing protein n=1 Tax=Dysgonomonas sp. BGC7 TaxID=1658008 RepID=UPI000680B72D|nr:SusE domain-containing protein [Dysgonomonas sp. BGC7]MBD8389244.1 SusE domain-containing protein [Dysgonomonas sp. BGC7]
MKKFNILYLFIFSLFAFMACTDEDEHTKLADKDYIAPSLKQDVLQNFVITEETNLEDSIGYWKWTAADYFIDSPASYNLQVDTLPTFETAHSIVKSPDKYMKITYKTLNDAALGFVTKSQKLTLYTRIRASLGTSEKGSLLLSETQQVTFTCRPSIKSVLYIVGNGLVGWGNDIANVGADLQLFFADNSGDAELKYVYTGTFNSGALKFPTAAGNWDKAYGYTGGKLVVNGGDYSTAGAGLYTLSVDLKAATVNMETYGGTVKTYSTMEVIGTAAKGWGDNDGTAMVNVATHVWIAKSITLKAGELKFREDKTWTNAWGASTKSDQEFPFGKTGGENFIIEEPGEYFLALNSLTGHYIIIPVKNLPK